MEIELVCYRPRRHFFFSWRLENIVCIELLRRYKPQFCDIFYYKEDTFQVDFLVAKYGNVQELIQVSYDVSNEKTRTREVRGLVNAARNLNAKTLPSSLLKPMKP